MKLNLSRLQEMLLEKEETREEGRELYEAILDALNRPPSSTCTTSTPSEVHEIFVNTLNEGDDDGS